MRSVLVFYRFCVALAGLMMLSAHAENTAVGLERREALSWLRRVESAAQKLNFSGTFVYQQGNLVRTSRITHFLDGKNEIEKLEVLDGKPREYIRNNDEIVCYVPETKTLLVEKRVTKDIFPAILAANPGDLAEQYDIHKGETGRIAGFEAQAIVLEPRDKLRYGYRLWAERVTGLLLRAQTLNEKGEAVEQITFTQLSIGNIDKSQVRPSFQNTRGWHVENAVMHQIDLSGWTVRGIPAGFRKIREMQRVLSDNTAAGLSNGQSVEREVSQIVFSDGLAAISVFIEPGSKSRTEGSVQQGAMNIVGKRQGDFWLTIMGEVPSAAIQQVANTIEYKGEGKPK